MLVKWSCDATHNAVVIMSMTTNSMISSITVYKNKDIRRMFYNIKLKIGKMTNIHSISEELHYIKSNGYSGLLNALDPEND